jgi:D-alanyl-D-alanine carboxypeptidase (penicillin-binding protein 5/6)
LHENSSFRLRGLLLAAAVALFAWLQAAPALAEPGFAPGRFAALAMDARTGKVVYARNADAHRYPASLTKLMTLYIAFEEIDRGRLKPGERITFSRHAAAQAPTKLGLRPGATMTVEDAMNVIAVKSANDVAVALAEHIAGSEPAFVARMNRKAKALGMTRTHFANASGLPNPRNVSTARDMAVLARATLRRHRDRYGIFDQASTRFHGRLIPGHNHLLGLPGVDGIKTGYIRASGFNIVTSAKRHGRRVIVVVLGGNTAAVRDRFAASLLETSLARVGPAAPRTRVARAAPPPARPPEAADGDAAWWVQVGAYRSQNQAVAALEALAARHPRRLGDADQWLDKVHGLYNARFAMDSRQDARETCRLLKAEGETCAPLAHAPLAADDLRLATAG